MRLLCSGGLIDCVHIEQKLFCASEVKIGSLYA